jgi:hypothetical protein
MVYTVEAIAIMDVLLLDTGIGVTVAAVFIFFAVTAALRESLVEGEGD